MGRQVRSDDGRGPVTLGGCLLSFLFVDPDHWGEGIGGLILDAVLDEAKRRHFDRIHLWTDEDSEQSQRLYRSRGFSPTGKTADG
jgi:GNAT superfamily N-acetyltransferase